MSSFTFARPAHTTADRSHRDAIRSADPIQPLRTMAERVGKEVEKFAERLDNWHVHGNDNAQTKYQTTVKVIGKFRDVAETQVKELKRAHIEEHKRELTRSVRRRVQDMAEAPGADVQDDLGKSSHSIASSYHPKHAQESAELHSLRQWQAELATWELVRIMIDQHVPEPNSNPAAAKQRRLEAAGGNKRHSKNSDIWDRFLLEDDHAKEKVLVLRWLEQTAQNDRSDIEIITAELEAQSGRGAHTWTSGWLDTKGKIKQAKRLEGADMPLQPDGVEFMTADGTQPLITQLDPDAPNREGRSLERSDDYYERALWMVCYEMLRRGTPWSQICEWAQERNEAWRGVSVGAACEAHPHGSPNLAGSTAGYLFRRMCFYAARGARFPYEGAVYALLSGDVKLAQVACRTWDDHLHAHYNALLLSRFDSYLQHNHPDRVSQNLAQKFVFQDAVATIGGWQDASQRVISLLQEQQSTTSESTEPFKLIQGALISRTMYNLVVRVGTGIADMLQDDERPVNLMIHPDSSMESAPKSAHEKRTFAAKPHHQVLATNPHALRILVHTSIAFKNGLHLFEELDVAKRPHGHLAMDNVIAAYIELLRITKRFKLIPVYAAQLEPNRTIHCFARIFPNMKNSAEQEEYIDLLKKYEIDIVGSIAQSVTFALDHCGLTHFEGKYAVLNKPVGRFRILEKASSNGDSLWPGYRIRGSFEGSSIEPKEAAVVEALQWLHYIPSDYTLTFRHLTQTLIIFLIHGRLAAAEGVISNLSVETLSLSRTEALCGYPFDFMHPDALEQDVKQLHAHRKTLAGSALKKAIPYEQLPGPDEHAGLVEQLRESSVVYYELQQVVHLLGLFREWRAVEESVIAARAEKPNPEAGEPLKAKVDWNHLKELLDTMESVFGALLSSMTATTQEISPENDLTHLWELKCAYVPEIVLAYISVLHTAASFLKREVAATFAIKAMEIANLVADEGNAWLQAVFVETKRMRELVEALAQVSKTMLRLSESEPKKSVAKKRGSKGETLRIWDLNAKDRV
ncbi:hypothetical protein CC86DRAFT_345795 [Ophiobolus disseminans]|uniref:Nuclear pore complex protein n=1 Tax=Ophiobolus disseminans TaxID=1469910 RepID=A0A6A7A7Q5_9PLEO|nr:hypothetical protein CC86DRAFT_345795 [Ophiobolus disseminans]